MNKSMQGDYCRVVFTSFLLNVTVVLRVTAIELNRCHCGLEFLVVVVDTLCLLSLRRSVKSNIRCGVWLRLVRSSGMCSVRRFIPPPPGEQAFSYMATLSRKRCGEVEVGVRFHGGAPLSNKYSVELEVLRTTSLVVFLIVFITVRVTVDAVSSAAFVSSVSIVGLTSGEVSFGSTAVCLKRRLRTAGFGTDRSPTPPPRLPPISEVTAFLGQLDNNAYRLGFLAAAEQENIPLSLSCCHIQKECGMHQLQTYQIPDNGLLSMN
uniref:Uncharacterized protein n=1 Tax=Glossina austeni TaxID=7395 RepID=A0A1A9UW30_GLOAU